MSNSWVQRYQQPRPTERYPVVDRAKVEGVSCDQCGGEDVRRYPVTTEHGARIATKCQACLHTLELVRPGPDDWWPPFRSLTYDWESSLSERASRAMLELSRDST